MVGGACQLTFTPLLLAKVFRSSQLGCFCEKSIRIFSLFTPLYAFQLGCNESFCNQTELNVSHGSKKAGEKKSLFHDSEAKIKCVSELCEKAEVSVFTF